MQDSDGNWGFIRDNKPYYVQGVGGHVHMDVAKEIGANSIRTWGVENALSILDEANANGLTVMMGLWVQHERHGFDYNDPVKVKNQLEAFKKVILSLKIIQLFCAGELVMRLICSTPTRKFGVQLKI